MATIIITGANRGLGLEFVRQYLNEGEHTIFACCRRPYAAVELQKLVDDHPQQVKMQALDVDDLAQIDALAQALSSPVDIIINNAGIFLDRNYGLGNLDYQDWQRMFLVNSMAPINQCHAPKNRYCHSG